MIFCLSCCYVLCWVLIISKSWLVYTSFFLRLSVKCGKPIMKYRFQIFIISIPNYQLLNCIYWRIISVVALCGSYAASIPYCKRLSLMWLDLICKKIAIFVKINCKRQKYLFDSKHCIHRLNACMKRFLPCLVFCMERTTLYFKILFKHWYRGLLVDIN